MVPSNLQSDLATRGKEQNDNEEGSVNRSINSFFSSPHMYVRPPTWWGTVTGIGDSVKQQYSRAYYSVVEADRPCAGDSQCYWSIQSGAQGLDPASGQKRLPCGCDAELNDVKQSLITGGRRLFKLKPPEKSQLQTNWKYVSRAPLYNPLPLNWDSSPIKIQACPMCTHLEDWLTWALCQA